MYSGTKDMYYAQQWSSVSDDGWYVYYFYRYYDIYIIISCRYFDTSLLDQAYLVYTYKVRIRLLTYKMRI